MMIVVPLILYHGVQSKFALKILVIKDRMKEQGYS